MYIVQMLVFDVQTNSKADDNRSRYFSGVTGNRICLAFNLRCLLCDFWAIFVVCFSSIKPDLSADTSSL